MWRYAHINLNARQRSEIPDECLAVGWDLRRRGGYLLAEKHVSHYTSGIAAQDITYVSDLVVVQVRAKKFCVLKCCDAACGCGLALDSSVYMHIHQLITSPRSDNDKARRRWYNGIKTVIT